MSYRCAAVSFYDQWNYCVQNWHFPENLRIETIMFMFQGKKCSKISVKHPWRSWQLCHCLKNATGVNITEKPYLITI